MTQSNPYKIEHLREFYWLSSVLPWFNFFELFIWYFTASSVLISKIIIFLKCRISTPILFVRLSKRIEMKLTWLNYSLTDRINGRISIKKSSLWIETFPFFLCWFQWSWNSSSWNGLKWPQICSQVATRRSFIWKTLRIWISDRQAVELIKWFNMQKEPSWCKVETVINTIIKIMKIGYDVYVAAEMTKS